MKGVSDCDYTLIFDVAFAQVEQAELNERASLRATAPSIPMLVSLRSRSNSVLLDLSALLSETIPEDEIDVKWMEIDCKHSFPSR